MDEINSLVKKALDSGIGSYYRKDAVRQLARLHKSAELSQAVVKLLKDVDDPSLQREVMDLASKFAITEAINLLLPISTSKGMNARYAINVLAKIGGHKAYDTLRKIAAMPGFDLSKTAASRAMEEMRRRQPDIEKEEEEQAATVIDEAENLADKITAEVQQSIKDITSNISSVSEEVKEEISVTASSAVTLAEEIKNKVAEKIEDAQKTVAVNDKKETKKKKSKAKEAQNQQKESKPQIPVDTQKEINTLKSEVERSKRDLAERDAKIGRLTDEVKALKNKPSNDAKNKELQRALHEVKEENARLRAAFEKRSAIQKSKITELEQNVKNARRKVQKNKKSQNGGCGTVIFIIFIIFFITKFLGAIF